jgi:hypothetical protein
MYTEAFEFHCTDAGESRPMPPELAGRVGLYQDYYLTHGSDIRAFVRRP